MKLDDMLQGFSAQTRFAAEVVVNVGVRAQELWFWDKANVSHSIRAKLQLGSDHLAGLADYQGQRYTLERFASLFPKVRFFAEESTNGLPNRLRSMVINRSKLHKLPQEFRTIDPVDGSVDYYSGGAEWCVGSAGWKDGRFTDGVAFAPDLKGGLVCVGEKGKGCKVGRFEREKNFFS